MGEEGVVAASTGGNQVLEPYSTSRFDHPWDGQLSVGRSDQIENKKQRNTRISTSFLAILFVDILSNKKMSVSDLYIYSDPALEVERYPNPKIICAD